MFTRATVAHCHSNATRAILNARSAYGNHMAWCRASRTQVCYTTSRGMNRDTGWDQIQYTYAYRSAIREPIRRASIACIVQIMVWCDAADVYNPSDTSGKQKLKSAESEQYSVEPMGRIVFNSAYISIKSIQIEYTETIQKITQTHAWAMYPHRSHNKPEAQIQRMNRTMCDGLIHAHPETHICVYTRSKI